MVSGAVVSIYEWSREALIMGMVLVMHLVEGDNRLEFIPQLGNREREDVCRLLAVGHSHHTFAGYCTWLVPGFLGGFL